MKLQHYLGGLENLGAVGFERQVFVEEWEKRIFGIHVVMMALSRHLNAAIPAYRIDQVDTAFRDTWTWASLRTGAEGMNPFEYFKFRYYEKWLQGISGFFLDQGYLRQSDLDRLAGYYRINPDGAMPAMPNPTVKQQVIRYLNYGDSGRRMPSAAPRFAVGDTIEVADPAAADHTRLPGFLRGKRGKVVDVYPDAYEYFVTTGQDGLAGPQTVYCVAFDAAELWGPAKSEANTVICADLFDAYIGPVSTLPG